MNKKTINIDHRELLDTIQIIHIIRKLHDDRAEVNDSEYLGSIIYDILSKLHNDEDGCTIELDTEQRFAVWLSLGQYKDFTVECNHPDENKYISNVMEKFCGL